MTGPSRGSAGSRCADLPRGPVLEFFRAIPPPVLVPILLNSHPGTKYGIPFPVLVRSSFGIRGANVAAMARALVACGWFGIQTWIGALALDTLMTTLTSGWADVTGHKAIAFGVFWIVQVAIILRGIDGIKFLESYAAPLLIGGSVGLLIWGFAASGNVFSASSQLIGGDDSFWSLFGPGLAANVGYWITLSMNIPDFTRYAKDQRSQILGGIVRDDPTDESGQRLDPGSRFGSIIACESARWEPASSFTRSRVWAMTAGPIGTPFGSPLIQRSAAAALFDQGHFADVEDGAAPRRRLDQVAADEVRSALGAGVHRLDAYTRRHLVRRAVVRATRLAEAVRPVASNGSTASLIGPAVLSK